MSPFLGRSVSRLNDREAYGTQLPYRNCQTFLEY